MAATPFTGAIITCYPTNPDINKCARGPTIRFNASDVAGASVTFPDISATTAQYPMPTGGLLIDDIILSAAGVDTKALQFKRDVAATDKILRDAVMVETLSVDKTSRTQGLRGKMLDGGHGYGLIQLA
jgi:hypothetical protein